MSWFVGGSGRRWLVLQRLALQNLGEYVCYCKALPCVYRVCVERLYSHLPLAVCRCPLALHRFTSVGPSLVTSRNSLVPMMFFENRYYKGCTKRGAGWDPIKPKGSPFLLSTCERTCVRPLGWGNRVVPKTRESTLTVLMRLVGLNWIHRRSGHGSICSGFAGSRLEQQPVARGEGTEL